MSCSMHSMQAGGRCLHPCHFSQRRTDAVTPACKRMRRHILATGSDRAAQTEQESQWQSSNMRSSNTVSWGAHENSNRWLASAHQNDRQLVSTKKTVDRRVYDQVAASRNRLSKQLSSKNCYIWHLQAACDERTEAVAKAHKAIRHLETELESIKRLSEVAIAAASFGADKTEAVERSTRILQRTELLQKSLLTESQALDKLMVRRVPIEWYGIASEVKLMGDFDQWSEGFSLSPEQIQDQTFTQFRADVQLLPGAYRVKFKIDDMYWRLAPDWPTADEPDGSTNNVLIVD